eukprot:2085005-Pleurochrysis_carterae.AAC.1
MMTAPPCTCRGCCSASSTLLLIGTGGSNVGKWLQRRSRLLMRVDVDKQRLSAQTRWIAGCCRRAENGGGAWTRTSACGGGGDGGNVGGGVGVGGVCDC